MKNLFSGWSDILRPSLRPALIIPAASLIICAALGMGGSIGVHSAGGTSVIRASFTPNGSASLPDGFRRWEHVGTRVKTSGRSILDGAVILRPQVLDTYVEPSAFIAYKKTGTWPDGTQIVKELSIVRVGDDCDKTTFSCSTPAGPGIFEDSYIGVGMMVKDRTWFPDAPGNWGYFRFLATGSKYAETSSVLPASQCQSCHVKFASKEDYVFTDTHIGLTSANVH
jgi:hypothetical protein